MKIMTMTTLPLALCAAPALAQDAGYDAAERAYSLQAAGDHQGALEASRAAVAAAPQNAEYLALLAQEAEAVERWGEAAEAYAASARLAGNPDEKSYRYRAGVYAHVMAGDRVAARALLDEAARHVVMDGDVDWAMVAIAAGDDRTAQRLLGNGDPAPSLSRQQLLDSGYSAKRAGMDARAVRFFRQGLAAPGEPLRADQRAAIEQEIALLASPFTLSGQVALADADRAQAIFNQSGPRSTSLQGGLELGYRPLGWRNGRPLTLFARAFHSSALDDDIVPQSTTQGWLGVQYKPVEQANLVLEASRLIALDEDAIDDWSLRTAFSHDRGLEIAPDRRAWPMMRVYADLAYLVDNEVAFGVLEGRLGQGLRVGERTVLAPHGVVHLGYDSNRTEDFGLSAGPGLSLRHWLERGAGIAPSYIDLTVQYRESIAGEDTGGALVTLSFGR